MWADYKAFLLRGNLIEMATAFILGVAFASVVTAFTEGIVMQLISAVVAQPDFSDVVVDLGGTPILIGDFLTALVNFVLVATALFVFVQGVDRLRRRTTEEQEADSEEVVLLREIRDALRTPR